MYTAVSFSAKQRLLTSATGCEKEYDKIKKLNSKTPNNTSLAGNFSLLTRIMPKSRFFAQSSPEQQVYS